MSIPAVRCGSLHSCTPIRERLPRVCNVIFTLAGGDEAKDGMRDTHTPDWNTSSPALMQSIGRVDGRRAMARLSQPYHTRPSDQGSKDRPEQRDLPCAQGQENQRCLRMAHRLCLKAAIAPSRYSGRDTRMKRRILKAATTLWHRKEAHSVTAGKGLPCCLSCLSWESTSR